MEQNQTLNFCGSGRILGQIGANRCPIQSGVVLLDFSISLIFLLYPFLTTQLIGLDTLGYPMVLILSLRQRFHLHLGILSRVQPV